MRLGLEKKYCSTRSINTKVLSLAKDKKSTLDKLIKAGKKAVNEDGADILVLGCMVWLFMILLKLLKKIRCTCN